MPLKITILGSGPSGGVPQVGGFWGACDPEEPKNRRRRVSVLVRTDSGGSALIDTSPDCRQQLLDAGVSRLDAVLYTHTHADHCHGIDDLRWVCLAMRAAIPVYGTAPVLGELQARFGYCFPEEAAAEAASGTSPKGGYYRPLLMPRVIQGPFDAAGARIIPFEQDHGFGKTTGFRIGGFAYSTDVVKLNEKAFDVLAGVDTWVVDALQIKPHPTHAHLDQALAWIEQVKPRRAILTHMNFNMDYNALRKILPDGVEPAWDGMELEVPDDET